MELSLKDSELRYRRLFEAAQDGILILDATTGMIEDVNPYLINMLGYSRAEFVKKKLWEVGAFKDTEASQAAFEVLQDREYIRYEDLPLRTQDGRMIEVEFVSNVYLVGDKKVIQCDIRDITEHRRIIAALHVNENKYHDLINQSPDGYFVIELSGNILTANKAMCKELEFSEEEFLSMNIWDIIPEQYLYQYKERLTKVLKGESLREATEYVVQGKYGALHYVEVISAPRYSGRDIIGFQGIARDVTARKRAEEALLTSEEKFRRLVVHLPTVVYINAVGDASSTLYVSPQIETLLGYTPQEWMADPKSWSKTLHPEDRQEVLKRADHTDRSSVPFEMDYRMLARDGRLVWVHDQITLVNDLEGRPQFWQGIMLDITERKRGEEKLQESEEKYRNLVETSHDLIWAVDAQGRITFMNQASWEIYGYAPEELIGRHYLDLLTPEERIREAETLPKLLASGAKRMLGVENEVLNRDGTHHTLMANAVVLYDSQGNVIGTAGTSTDITERKQAEEQTRFQANLLNAVGQAIIATDAVGTVTYINRAAENLYGWRAEETRGRTILDLTVPQVSQIQAEEILAYLSRGESWSGEFHVQRRDGRVFAAEVHDSPIFNNENELIGIIGLSSDITERKQVEEALQASEAKFRSYNEYAPLGVFIVDQSGRYVEVNAAAIKMLGQTESELLQLSIPEVLAPQSVEAGLRQFQKVVQDGSAPQEFQFRRKDGTQFWATVLWVRLSEDRFMSYCQDITERKQAEEILREKERLLSEAQRIGHIGSWNYDIATDALQYSDEMYHLLDVSRQEFQHDQAGFLSVIYASDQHMVTKWMEDIKAGRRVKDLDFRLFHKNGELRYIQTSGAVIFNSAGKPARFTGTAQDVSERKLAEIQIRQQVQHLTALSKIDQAIISTSNLSIMMETLLSQVLEQLHVDSAGILLFNRDSQALEYFLGRGFDTQVYESARVPVGKSLARRVAKERRVLKIDQLMDQPDDPFVSELVAKEGFVSYLGVPLITKGRVTGVLELFHRTVLHPYSEWLDFLNTLAGQAALAIENATLVTTLELTNRELSQAYDATIEGWSRALDLRDKETEGHTLRVTELTQILAQKFNFTDKQLLHIRWGSLLHDIGKMGVPDSILLKPEELSEEEWVIMRHHPQYAYDLLQPIAFLFPALDIPYCHHERWDGKGYPRGLAGEAIPLQARIFSIVDVWDALSSDRPYRPRWPEEKIREHIQALSGTRFDPQVVDVFMRFLN